METRPKWGSRLLRLIKYYPGHTRAWYEKALDAPSLKWTLMHQQRKGKVKSLRTGKHEWKFYPADWDLPVKEKKVKSTCLLSEVWK